MPESVTSPELFRFGLFEVDCAREVLVRNGVRVRLQNQPFRVLIRLLERRGQIVTREELKEALWPDGTHVDFDGSLNVILKKLRAAIDDDSDNPRFIETVPRRGYRFIAPVEAVAAAKTQDLEPAAEDEPQPILQDAPEKIAATGRASHRWMLAAATALVVTVAGVVTYRAMTDRKADAHVSPGASDAAIEPVVLRPSVAVLGFDNLSGRPEDAWISAALAEMLGTELGGDGQLRLTSGQDVENLRIASPWPKTDSLDRPTSARVGSALNSNWLVLGSYTVLGNSESATLRLDVRLQSASTGQIVSEFSQMGTVRGIFQIVSQAGDRLRNHLGARPMVERDAASVLSAQPLDPEAARLYSLGVSKLRQYDPLAARDLLEQAVQVDPKFSLAHAMLARAWSDLGYGQKRTSEAKKALDLSSDLPQQLRMIVQAEYFASVGHLDQVASIDRALFELYPDDLDYGLNLAVMENENGHGSQAREVLARLRRLPPPASDDPRIDLGEAAVAGNKEQALILVRRAAARASAQGKRILYAQARRDECMNLLYGAHPEQGPAACNDAFQVFLSMGARGGAADALRLLGDGEGTQGHLEEALGNYRRALAYTEDLGEHEKTGAILNNMAIVLTNQGRLDDAEKMYRDAKAHFQAAGNLSNMATAVVNLADIAYLRGHLDAAEKQYRQGLGILSKLDLSSPGYVLTRLADVELTEGRVREAQLDATTAINVMKNEKGAFQYYTGGMNELGDTLRTMGKLTDAKALYDQAMALRKQMGEDGLVAEEQEEIALLRLDQKTPDKAEALLKSAISEFEKEDSQPAASSTYALLSRALLMEGRLEEARETAKRASDRSHATPDPSLRLSAAIVSAEVEAALARRGNHDERGLSAAILKLKSIAASAKQLGYFNLECDARLAMGRALLTANAAQGRAQLTELSEEARNKGYLLVAQKAEEFNRTSTDQMANLR